MALVFEFISHLSCAHFNPSYADPAEWLDQVVKARIFFHTHEECCKFVSRGDDFSYEECASYDVGCTYNVLTEDPFMNQVFSMYQGPCTSDSQCSDGLVCHNPTSDNGRCVCNSSTNEGCSSGEICDTPPGLYCPPGGCLPTCTCDYSSNALSDGSNGCAVGEVCRMPCALADAGPQCFASEEERDCDVYGPGYICRDGNGNGVIDSDDGGMGCVKKPVDPPAVLKFESDNLSTDDSDMIGSVEATAEKCSVEGHCRSPSGVCGPTVECLINPCATARCDSNTVCEANYCGGCHAVCS